MTLRRLASLCPTPACVVVMAFALLQRIRRTAEGELEAGGFTLKIRSTLRLAFSLAPRAFTFDVSFCVCLVRARIFFDNVFTYGFRYTGRVASPSPFPRLPFRISVSVKRMLHILQTVVAPHTFPESHGYFVRH